MAYHITRHRIRRRNTGIHRRHGSINATTDHDLRRFLSQASAPADPSNDEDRATATDLRDTLAAHRGECVGMAANMIGVAKRIIVFQDKENNRNAIMFNPRIIAGSDPFDTAEGCLSLDGERPTTRYQSITVTYQARSGREYTTAFDGFTAQIIQHEIDHVNGIII